MYANNKRTVNENSGMIHIRLSSESYSQPMIPSVVSFRGCVPRRKVEGGTSRESKLNIIESVCMQTTSDP